jgi:hypothetical protein
MKADRSIFTVLLLVTAAIFQLPAQQNEADRKMLAEIRAGADKGDAKAQYELGRAFFSGCPNPRLARAMQDGVRLALLHFL